MSKLSQKILDAMKKNNISYGELSAETNIPKSALQRYATGETEKIPVDRLEKIAAALHVDTAWLLGWNSEAASSADPLEGIDFALADAYKDLSPEAKNDIIKYAEFRKQQEEAEKKKK